MIMNRKHKVILTGLSLFTVIGIGIMVYRKKKQNQKNADYLKFSTQLQNNQEPEKINRADLQQAFNTNYWKTVSSNGRTKPVISSTRAKEIAKRIYGAWNAGSFWDDLEQEVYLAFEDQHLQSFADVSRVAYEYTQKSIAGKDLWKHLAYKLSESEFAKVKGIVAKKNAY